MSAIDGTVWGGEGDGLNPSLWILNIIMNSMGRQIDYSKIPTEEWSKFPETTPTENGYYLTTYQDKSQPFGHLYYKCLYWDGNNREWIWHKPFEVGCFVEKTRSKYYTECLNNLEKLIENV